MLVFARKVSQMALGKLSKVLYLIAGNKLRHYGRQHFAEEAPQACMS